MQLKKFHILPVILMLFFSVSLSGCQFDNGRPINQIFSSVENVGKSPQIVFLKAWNAIRQEYLDKTYNDQDWSRWKSRYLKQIKTKDDSYLAIETMLESLNDPYTRFLSPSDFEEQDMNIDAKLFGIGVHITEKEDDIIIVDVIDGTPAKKVGLKAKDKIIKVDEKPTDGLSVKEVAKIVRGPAGTHVKVTILRDKTRIVKDILREEIYLKSVEHKMIDNKYAYIKISSFISQDASIEMANALEKTKNAEGIILDLRGNFGGLLPNAVFIANMFIKDGTIVSIVDKEGYKESISAEPFDISINKPLVVLVNEASASASEILSGALKDHKRAVLVGQTTFGKGLVQKIHRLPDGSGLNITIAKYLTPKGYDINKIGIKPDYQVEMTEKDIENKKDPQLDKAKQILATEIKKQSKIVTSTGSR